MPRRVVGGDDGVPDHGLGGRDGGGVGRGVGGGDVEEDLLGVPVEEGAEVGVEGEGDVGVLFAAGAVVVGAAGGSVGQLGQDVAFSGANMRTVRTPAHCVV